MAERSDRSLQALAQQGDVFAQLTLMDRYLRGDGVRQDYHLAAKWFDRVERRADLTQSVIAPVAFARWLTPEQVKEAEKRAREWVEVFKLLPRD
jgi:TPR repeat protein